MGSAYAVAERRDQWGRAKPLWGRSNDEARSRDTCSAREACGMASQIAAVVSEKGFGLLTAPIRRVANRSLAIPHAPNAEQAVISGEEQITAAVVQAVGRGEKVSA